MPLAPEVPPSLVDEHEVPYMDRRAWLRRAGAAVCGNWYAAQAWAEAISARKASPALSSSSSPALQPPVQPKSDAVILVYHRFADTVQDSMTVRKANFATHLQAIRDAGAHVIALADLVAHRQGRLATLPPRPVVITADDGHRSVYEAMAPMMAPTGWPVTLFIYPSAISNASYAMRWEHIKALQATGHYSVQSHTYWHPNLVKERRQQVPDAFEKFASMQLRKSKAVLEERMGQPVSHLAWPFGLFDEGLMKMAADAGYQTALALGNKPCAPSDPLLALPRYLMVDEISGERLQQILNAAWPPGVSA